MRIAVLNAGTGTVKLALVEVARGASRLLLRETVERAEDEPSETAVLAALARLPRGDAGAVAHRVVHGGSEFVRAVRLDDAVERALEALVPLAPLHNPPALEGIRLARRALPELPAVAVFDTAFHAGRAPASRLYALPRDVARAHALERYGFHGLAHAALLEALAHAQGADPGTVDAVTLQLGSGCSACAIEGGRSVETSMGFTPLEGLPMATRSGDVDPSIVIHLLRSGYTLDGVETLLNREAGFRGLAGSPDVRAVLRAEAEGDPDAALALGLFVRRVVATVGAYFTLLGGRGSLVFGGGIGTNSAEVRGRVAAGLAAWDVALDPERNRAGTPGLLSRPGSRPVFVFETQEEPLIAREAAALLGEAG